MVKNDCPPSEHDFVTVHHGGGVAKRPFFDAKGRFTPEKPIVDYEGLMHWNAAQAEIAHTLYHFEYPRGPGEYPVVHSPIAWILFDHRLPGEQREQLSWGFRIFMTLDSPTCYPRRPTK